MLRITQFQSEGILEYGPGLRAVVWVDVEIARYYRSLIPKAKGVRPSMYKPHITVVRMDLETPKNLEKWNVYAGERVPFIYENEIKSDGTYYWINVYSERIEDIREELGLNIFRLGYRRYHITLGNTKEDESSSLDKDDPELACEKMLTARITSLDKPIEPR